MNNPSIPLGSGFILLSGATLQALLSAGLPPRLVIYDEDYSVLARSLADQGPLRVSIAAIAFLAALLAWRLKEVEV